MMLTEVQGAQDFVARSALTSGSTEFNSIEGIEAYTIQDGAEAYAILEMKTYRYIADSLEAPSGTTVILPSSLDVSEPGRWIEVVAGGAGGSEAAAQLRSTAVADGLMSFVMEINQSGFSVSTTNISVPSNDLFQFILTVEVDPDPAGSFSATIVKLDPDGEVIGVPASTTLLANDDTVGTAGLFNVTDFTTEQFAVEVVSVGENAFSAVLDIVRVQAAGPTGATGATGAGGGETLAQTLVIGNVTGGTDIVQTNGDALRANGANGNLLIASRQGTITIRSQGVGDGESGGDVTVEAGDGPSGASGAGGSVFINSGAAGATGGLAGDIELQAGAGPSVAVGGGPGGSISATAGAGGTDGGGGGNITLAAGSPVAVAGAGGYVLLTGGPAPTGNGGGITLDAGDGDTAGGDIFVSAGSVLGAANGGFIRMDGGQSPDGQAGEILLEGGLTQTGVGGSISLSGGGGGLTGISGFVNIQSGLADVETGRVTLKSGNSGVGAGVDVTTGDVFVASGNVDLTASGNTSSGDVSVRSGDNPTGDTGSVVVEAGISAANGGGIAINGGDGVGSGGGINIQSGDASGVDGAVGTIDIVGGTASGGGGSSQGGSVRLIVGEGDIRGRVIFQVAPGVFLRFPEDDGTPGQVLSTDGSGNLSWITP